VLLLGEKIYFAGNNQKKENAEKSGWKGGYIAAWHNPYLPPLVQKVECPQECGRVWERAWKLFVVTEYRQAS
jgi:hypothetical protein